MTINRPISLWLWLGLTIAVAAVVGLYWWWLASHPAGQPTSGRGIVVVTPLNQSSQSISFDVALALTPAQQTKGLAGVSTLEPGYGMYFPLNPHMPTSFWMKDMVMAIDIIWIKGGRIVQINAEVPPPTAGQTDGQLPTYSYEAGGAEAVLEIGAGQATAQQLAVGQQIDLLTQIKTTQ